MHSSQQSRNGGTVSSGNNVNNHLNVSEKPYCFVGVICSRKPGFLISNEIVEVKRVVRFLKKSWGETRELSKRNRDEKRYWSADRRRYEPSTLH
jgi:hypothetical protein